MSGGALTASLHSCFANNVAETPTSDLLFIEFRSGQGNTLFHLCQELDSSRLLDVSIAVLLGTRGSVVRGSVVLDESAKLKLDKR